MTYDQTERIDPVYLKETRVSSIRYQVSYINLTICINYSNI